MDKASGLADKWNNVGSKITSKVTNFTTSAAGGVESNMGDISGNARVGQAMKKSVSGNQRVANSMKLNGPTSSIPDDLSP